MTAEASVIIAAYNVENYIERAVRSALEWQGVTVEVIVVDNASTDRTVEAVSNIDDARIKLIQLPDNTGPSGARNTGIAVATAPWIAILDGDDAFLPEHLLRCLTRARAIDADIVVDNLTVFREEDGTTYPMFNPPHFARLMTLDLAHFIDGNRSLFGGAEALGYLKPLFKTEFLRRHNLRYEPDIRIGEDYLLMCEALAYGARCGVVGNAGYLYTVRKGSISHRLTLADVERMQAGDRRFLARHKLGPMAALAQKRRDRALKEAADYIRLVDAIKARNFREALRIATRYPLAARHLWEPVWVRVKRLFKKAHRTNGVQKLLERKTILLFYKEHEADKFFKYDHFLKRVLRPLYHLTHRRQKKTGFAVSFDLMRRGLVKAGYNVRINDYRIAKKNPDYPVGLVGFPVLLENWTLPNPAVLGPSLYDHPMLAPDLMCDPRFKKYAVLAPWVLAMFKPVYGDACFEWFAGIDTEEWPDQSQQPKTYDFLIYDKIRWHHDELENTLLKPLLGILDKKNLTYRLVRYKMHDHATYKKMLAAARGLLFLCEHETQGIAYQEAMASNVPVLAWDAGFWADPLWQKFSPAPPPASSVPFFSPDCGETFCDLSAFDSALDRFTSRRDSYAPRTYVMQNLDMETSAQMYAKEYFGLIGQTA
jgi:succinoglycan biosynthesis protein ExoO